MPMHDTGVDEAMLGLVRAAMRGLEPPGHHTKVYKDECMFTFDTPESPGGLFINLRTFQVRTRCHYLCMIHTGLVGLV